MCDNSAGVEEAQSLSLEDRMRVVAQPIGRLNDELWRHAREVNAIIDDLETLSRDIGGAECNLILAGITGYLRGVLSEQERVQMLLFTRRT